MISDPAISASEKQSAIMPGILIVEAGTPIDSRLAQTPQTAEGAKRVIMLVIAEQRYGRWRGSRSPPPPEYRPGR